MGNSCAYHKCNLPATRESYIRDSDGTIIAIVPTCQPHSEMIKLGLANDRLVDAVKEALSRVFREKDELHSQITEMRMREARLKQLLAEWLDFKDHSDAQASEQWVSDFRSRVESILLPVGRLPEIQKEPDPDDGDDNFQY